MPAEPTPAFLTAVREAIAVHPVCHRHLDLAGRAADHVAGTGDGSVLPDLAARRAVAGEPDAATQRRARRAVYRLLPEAPPGAGYRWAQVISALSTEVLTLAPIAGADWAEVLLHDLAAARSFAEVDEAAPPAADYATLEAVVIAGGGAPGELLTAAFSCHPEIAVPAGLAPRAYADDFFPARALLASLPDYPAAVAVYADRLAALAVVAGPVRSLVLDLLAPLPDHDLRPFAPALAACLTDADPEIALAAESVADRCPRPDLVAALQTAADRGEPPIQLRALRALERFARPDEIADWLGRFAAVAASPAARALARDRAVSRPDPATADSPSTGRGAPDSAPVWQVPITDELVAALRRLQEVVNRHIDDCVAAERASPVPRVRAGAETRGRFDDAQFEHLLQLLGSPQPPSAVAPDRSWEPRHLHWPTAVLDDLIEVPGCTPEALLTVLAYLDRLRYPAGDRLLTGEAVTAITRLHDRTGVPDLYRLKRMLDDLGLDGTDLVFTAFCVGEQRHTVGWPAADLAPFAATVHPRFRDLLASPPTYQRGDDSATYRTLAALPDLPDDIADLLYGLALGSVALRRRPAQDVLAGRPGLTERLHTALRDSSAEVRAAAAEWLGRVGGAVDIPALEAAYRTERSARGQQELLNALAALGNPPSIYLNADTLAAAAERGMKKRPPPTLAWLDLGMLPPLRWRDSGDPVPEELVHWLVVDAVKAKSPEPSVALRHYCALFDPADAEALGDLLLDLWLTADETAAATGRRSPATAAKGVLAVCAATCRAGAAPAAERYIRKYYGRAASQCRALLGMLAWIDEPEAVAVLLSIATRFRTKGIQTEAQRQVAAVAERHGWTPEQLADRTVPDAGFGSDGRLVLDYGPRQFSARLGPDYRLVLFDPAGRPIRSLPTPRKADDPAAAAQAKRQLAAARKAVKSLVPQQIQRLEEAFYAERSWSLADWQRYLMGHPLLAVLCRRAVWLAEAGEENRLTFRPLEDGTLTDADDEEVVLGEPMRISLLRPGAVDDGVAQAWREHLADYEVTPLFDQFGEVYELEPDARTEQAIVSRRGYLIDDFTLRSTAASLGYLRGPVGDGGIYSAYERTFPTLKTVAHIGVSGARLPESGETVALTELTFTRIGDGTALMLREVPILLLGAATRDLETIAAAGTGHDDDWRSKVAFA